MSYFCRGDYYFFLIVNLRSFENVCLCVYISSLFDLLRLFILSTRIILSVSFVCLPESDISSVLVQTVFLILFPQLVCYFSQSRFSLGLLIFHHHSSINLTSYYSIVVLTPPTVSVPHICRIELGLSRGAMASLLTDLYYYIFVNILKRFLEIKYCFQVKYKQPC